MTIITMTDVSEPQRRAIARALGLRGLADREQVRAYLVRQQREQLDALTVPVLSVTYDQQPGA